MLLKFYGKVTNKYNFTYCKMFFLFYIILFLNGLELTASPSEAWIKVDHPKKNFKRITKMYLYIP